MVNIWNWIKNNPNRAMFLVPILLVAGISISHVVTWYDIANPLSWAIYLSIAIEVGAMTALVAATNKIKGGVWFMFGIVTLIQMIGNIFFSFKEIDSNGDLFKSWVELTGPMWEMIGSDPTDLVSMKRWLAFLECGLLPVISLTSLHFFVKYDESKKDIVVNVDKNEMTNDLDENEDEVTNDDRVRKYVDLQKEIWENVKKLREEGKLPTPTKEDIEEEPSALAFTPYHIEEGETEDDFSDLDNTLLDGLENEDSINLTESDVKIFVDEVTKEPESPNEVLQNALKKYKESKGVVIPPVKNKKSDIKRID